MSDRVMRFLIPVFLLVASLIWAFVSDPGIPAFRIITNAATAAGAETAEAIVGLLVTSGIATLATGFLLNLSTLGWLHLLYYIMS